MNLLRTRLPVATPPTILRPFRRRLRAPRPRTLNRFVWCANRLRLTRGFIRTRESSTLWEQTYFTASFVCWLTSLRSSRYRTTPTSANVAILELTMVVEPSPTTHQYIRVHPSVPRLEDVQDLRRTRRVGHGAQGKEGRTIVPFAPAEFLSGCWGLSLASHLMSGGASSSGVARLVVCRSAMRVDARMLRQPRMLGHSWSSGAPSLGFEDCWDQGRNARPVLALARPRARTVVWICDDSG